MIVTLKIVNGNSLGWEYIPPVTRYQFKVQGGENLVGASNDLEKFKLL